MLIHLIFKRNGLFDRFGRWYMLPGLDINLGELMDSEEDSGDSDDDEDIFDDCAKPKNPKQVKGGIHQQIQKMASDKQVKPKKDKHEAVYNEVFLQNLNKDTVIYAKVQQLEEQKKLKEKF